MSNEDFRSDVDRALLAVFGDVAREQETPLTAGLSGAYVARVVVRGAPYLVRAGSRAAPGLRLAAEAGLAPRLRYSDERVIVSDYVTPARFPPDAAERIAALLRRLHALTPPEGTITHHQIDTSAHFIGAFRALNVPVAIDDVVARFEAVAATWSRTLVLCHNDLKPQNILFDGARPWLIDWEAAFFNEAYSDLAIVADFFARTPDAEERFLGAYLDRAPSDEDLTRFRTMRFVSSVCYAACFLMLAARGGASFANPAAPDYDAFHDRLIAAAEAQTRDPEADLLRPEVQLGYGLVHLEAARRLMASPHLRR